MHQERHITEDLYFVGSGDRRLNLFENIFPLPNGITYNSYLALDEKTVLLDTVDKAISKVFFENIEFLLKGRTLDYLIITHMEPDHSATLAELILRYPEVTIVGNSKTFTLISQFFDFEVKNKLEVKEGDCLSTGKHNFSFFMAPMVHWPEVMVVYDSYLEAVFSADAFGTFGAFSGNIFSDEIEFEKEWLSEARRYYSNIVGKYGLQTSNMLKKLDKLKISYICPLHGPIWRDANLIKMFLGKYKLWANYMPEENNVCIFYGSIYGGTEEIANILAGELAKLGVKNTKVYDVSITDTSFLVSEAWRSKVLVFASASYNAGLFPKMEVFLEDLKSHTFQNRHIALIENGSWALSAGKKMAEILSSCKNLTMITDTLSFKSTLKDEQVSSLEELAKSINLVCKL